MSLQQIKDPKKLTEIAKEAVIKYTDQIEINRQLQADNAALRKEITKEKKLCDEAHVRAGDRWKQYDAEKQNHDITKKELAILRAKLARLEMKLRAICPHKKFHEVSFEDGYPGGDIATYECEYCGYHFTGELPQ